jgi:hypothetical protein
LVLCTFAYKFTSKCPFAVIAKYLADTKNLNFFRYWKLAYGNKTILSTCIYVGYTIFALILLFI